MTVDEILRDPALVSTVVQFLQDRAETEDKIKKTIERIKADLEKTNE